MGEFVETYIKLGGLALFFIAMIYLLYKYFDTMIEIYKKKMLALLESKNLPDARERGKLKPIEADELPKHQFFAWMNTVMSTTIPHIKLNHKGKEACLIDFLLIKFRVFRDIMMSFVKQDVAYSMEYTALEWETEIINTYLVGIDSYEQEAIKIGIPTSFVTEFNNRHAARVQQAVELTKNLSHTAFIDNNGLRTMGALDLLITVFQATIFDAEHTMDNIPITPELDCYQRKVRVI